MQNAKRYLRIASVLVVAAGTGHLMQSGALSRGGVTAHLSVPMDAPLMQVTQIRAPSTRDEIAPAVMPETPAAGRGPAAPALVAPSISDTGVWADAGGCAATLTARDASAGNLNLSLDAPCRPDASVRIHYASLDLPAETDAAGHLALVLPALATGAIIARFDDLRTVSVRIDSPSLASHDRVAVVWQNADAVEFHAFESGAGYTDKGHVWRGNPQGPDGTLTRIGSTDDTQPALGEVYSCPAGSSEALRLSLEAKVTAANCGKDISANVIEVFGGVLTGPIRVTIAMPGCRAKGDIVALDLPLPDRRVASR